MPVQQGPVDLAARLPLADGAALVVALLASGQGELDLGARSLEVDPGRHQGQALLGCLADESLDLAPVHQQLARPLRIVVLPGGRLVGRDVHPKEPHLAVADLRVRILELHGTGAQRLDLRPLELDPALPLLEQVVAERRLAVGGDVPRLGLALLPFRHRAYEYVPVATRSTRPRGGSTRSTTTSIESPRRNRWPDSSETSAVPSSFTTHQPRSRRTGRKPSYPSSPKRTNAPFSIRPTTSPSRGRSERLRSSRKARQTSSASRP